MKKRNYIGIMVVALALAGGMAMAQGGDDSKPASTNTRTAQYPRVHADGRVSFRVKAPAALKVAVHPVLGNASYLGDNGLGKDDIDLTKGDDGYWMGTSGPTVPGFHYYMLVIDGAEVADPGSRTFWGADHELSGVEIPAPGVDFYAIKDVPHGSVHIEWYLSKVTGQWRRSYVYTPPGYDQHPQEKYPVLYLRNGGGEDESAYLDQGRAGFILDNLLAAGKAKPMILAMESGYGLKPGEQLPPPPPPPAPGATPTFTIGAPATVDEETVTDFVPMVDARYRTIADRDHRAMAGSSMGGSHTISIGLKHMDVYSELGIFSWGPQGAFDVKTLFGGVFTDAAGFNKKEHLFYFASGTGEAGLNKTQKSLLAALDGAGIKYAAHENPGLSHEFQNWRNDLVDFMPRLFR